MHLIIKKQWWGEQDPIFSVVGTAKTYEQATKLIEAHNLINKEKMLSFMRYSLKLNH